MCGLVALLTSDTSNSAPKVKYFSEALLADSLRGHDSTGVFAVNKNLTDVDLFKRAMDAPDFMSMRQYIALKGCMTTAKFIVGHNRAATKGALTHHNAHPFHHGSIIMVHNGTLTNHRSLVNGDKFAVDSEAFTYSMDKIGAKATLETVQGAFAVIWYDTDTKKLYMARNDERPLHYAFSGDGKSVLVASEALMIPWLAARNGTKIQLKSLKEVPVGEILSFDPKDVQSIDKESFTPKEDFYSYENAWKYEGTRSYYSHGSRSSNKSSTKTKTSKNNIADRLSIHGLSYKDIIMFDGVSYDKYGGGSHSGKILGLYIPEEGKDVLEVQAHNVPTKLYEKDAIYCGTVMGIMKGKTPKEDVIILRDIEIAKIPETEEKKEETSYANDEATFRGPRGLYINRSTFMELTSDGCSYCQESINPLQSDELSWLDTAHGGGVLCPTCAQDMQDSGMIVH